MVKIMWFLVKVHHSVELVAIVWNGGEGFHKSYADRSRFCLVDIKQSS